jgi:hypothetical protein
VYFSFWVIEPNYAMTGIWLTFSLFTFLFGWPERIESISFLGNNIKLREMENATREAKSITNDAKYTINELKQLAAISSSVILESIQSSGRWGGYTEEKRLESFNTIHKMLKSFGFTCQEIETIESPWHNWNEIDYINGILNMGNVYHP